MRYEPPRGSTVAYNLEGLDAIRPWLLHVHAFTWREREQKGGPAERLPLAEGNAAWAQYLAKVAAVGHDCFAELEFVRDDAPAQFLEDAATLRDWLSVANAERGT